MSKPDDGGDERKYPDRELYTLTDLEQIKVLADPLRVRLLEAFCQERTTKQVADLLGEKPTRLYHHVEAMERVGLIELSRTRQNRGTLEKYYLAVARAFRVDREVFPTADRPSDEEADVLRQAVATYFERTVVELGEVIGRGKGGDLEAEGIITFCEVHGTDTELREIRRELKKALRLIAALDPERAAAMTPAENSRSTGTAGAAADVASELGADAATDAAADSGAAAEATRETARYRLLLALFPLPPHPDADVD